MIRRAMFPLAILGYLTGWLAVDLIRQAMN